MPDLRRRADSEAVIRSRVLRTWGRSESGLAEVLADEIDRLDAEGGPTLAFLASGMEGLKVRITAKGADEDEVAAVLADEEERVREIVGPIVFGVDDQNMESVVLDELVAQGLTLATAESLTGGMIGTRLTDVPGASRAFRGAIVAYDGDVKRGLLGVPEGPVVSEAAVVAMAEGACRVLCADVSVAVTGVAGPDPQDGEKPGTVWMAHQRRWRGRGGEGRVPVAPFAGITQSRFGTGRQHPRQKRSLPSQPGTKARAPRLVVAAETTRRCNRGARE